MHCTLLENMVRNLLSTLVNYAGLSLEELGRLATLGKRAQKTARRDIAHIVSSLCSNDKVTNHLGLALAAKRYILWKISSFLFQCNIG